MLPFISVIVPIYKTQPFLDRCIRSIANQTYRNVEIILVDDGSPDDCPRICDEWALQDCRVKVIHKVNGGLSDARNAGLRIAKSDYVAFVDSDDYVETTYLEDMFAALDSTQADMAICGFRFVSSEGVLKNASDTYLRTIVKTVTPDSLYPRLSDNWYITAPWCKLYKKDIFSSIEFPRGKVHEDNFVIHKILFACKEIVLVPKLLYNYIENTDGITHQSRNLNQFDVIEALCDRALFYLEKGKTDFISATVDEMFRRYAAISNGFRNQGVNLHTAEAKERLSHISHMWKCVYRDTHKFLSREVILQALLFNISPGTYCGVRRLMSKLIKPFLAATRKNA